MSSRIVKAAARAPAAASIVMMASLILVGCAHDIPLQTSERIPAAQGQVKVSKGNNDNTKMKVEVAHLADPQKMTAGAVTYVVWIQSAPGHIQNVGALEIDASRRGKLETVTPHQDFQVFVTAEPIPTAPAPTSERLMFANVRRD